MTTAALRCAVISDPRIFENEPTWNSNYSSSNYTLVKGSPSSTFFFSFLILIPLSLTMRQMLQMERGCSVALGMVCSVHWWASMTELISFSACAEIGRQWQLLKLNTQNCCRTLGSDFPWKLLLRWTSLQTWILQMSDWSSGPHSSNINISGRISDFSKL